MIHNITEERKKLNRRDASLPAPLTEEELMRLIGTVEERELLHAPGHLKENICSHIHAGKRREKTCAFCLPCQGFSGDGGGPGGTCPRACGWNGDAEKDTDGYPGTGARGRNVSE